MTDTGMTDTGGPAYPIAFQHEYEHESEPRAGYTKSQEWEGMTLLDAAALAALPEILRTQPNDKTAVIQAYDVGEEFIAEKRRRESG